MTEYPMTPDDDDLALYLLGSIRAGKGWHYCYTEPGGSWKNDPSCEHDQID